MFRNRGDYSSIRNAIVRVRAMSRDITSDNNNPPPHCPRVGQILFFCRGRGEIIAGSEANESITLSDKKLLLPAIRISLFSSVPRHPPLLFSLRFLPFSLAVSHRLHRSTTHATKRLDTLAKLGQTLRHSLLYTFPVFPTYLFSKQSVSGFLPTFSKSNT